MPPAHFGEVTLGFQWVDNRGHLLTTVCGHDVPRQECRMPLSTSPFSTPSPIGCPPTWACLTFGPKSSAPASTPPPFLPVDSCYCWHGGFQDFGLIVRYNAIGEIGGAFALTPSVAVGTPSSNYDYQGEAVVGRNLEEVALALDVGQRLDFISPLLSVQGRYAYAFVERVLDIPNNRSNFSVEAVLPADPHSGGARAGRIGSGRMAACEPAGRRSRTFCLPATSTRRSADEQHDRLLATTTSTPAPESCTSSLTSTSTRPTSDS